MWFDYTFQTIQKCYMDEIWTKTFCTSLLFDIFEKKCLIFIYLEYKNVYGYTLVLKQLTASYETIGWSKEHS